MGEGGINAWHSHKQFLALGSFTPLAIARQGLFFYFEREMTFDCDRKNRRPTRLWFACLEKLNDWMADKPTSSSHIDRSITTEVICNVNRELNYYMEKGN